MTASLHRERVGVTDSGWLTGDIRDSNVFQRWPSASVSANHLYMAPGWRSLGDLNLSTNFQQIQVCESCSCQLSPLGWRFTHLGPHPERDPCAAAGPPGWQLRNERQRCADSSLACGDHSGLRRGESRLTFTKSPVLRRRRYSVKRRSGGQVDVAVHHSGHVGT